MTTISLYQFFFFSLMSCFGRDERTTGELHTKTLLKATGIKELEGRHAHATNAVCLGLDAAV